MSLKTLTKKISKTFVLQHDQSDCGVACLLSIIHYYGGINSLEKLRELSGTTRQGTTLLGLYQTANQIGFTAQGNEADIQAIIEHQKPLILHVVIENRLQHYVVCYGFKNNKFIIGDPSKGVNTYTKDELNAIWVSKTCLVLEPNNYFIKADKIEKKKKEWFLNVLKEDKKLLTISLVLGIGIALLGMAMSIFSQKLIDDILPSQNIKKLGFGIGLLTFLLFVRVGFSALRELMLIKQTKDFNNRIVNSFYTSLLHLPKPFFDTRKIGELVARLNDTNRVQKVIKFIASNVIIDVLIVLVSLGFLIWYSYKVGVIALVSLPIYFILIFQFNKKIINAQKEVMQSYALSESNYISSMQGITTIKNNNKQTVFKKINQLVYGNLQNKIFNLGKINVRLSLVGGVLSIVFLITILAYTSFQVYYKQMDLGELMAILGISGSLLPSITNLALVTIPINEAKIAFNRMFEFTSIEKERTGTIQLYEFNKLEIKNISFRFAGRRQLLKDISITINRGNITAIAGESGSGKSTIGQIIQLFYHFETGEIIVNDQYNLSDICIASWRDNIGVVPQEITIFNGNVIENILLGEEDPSKNILNFCKEYGFDDFIKELPQGYTSILGEEGINLSGGQKQIIALARALYKKPKLLLLDEPTSAMDRKTEKFTFDLVRRVADNIGVFLISHRLETLKRYADIIYVLEKGKVSQYGTHKELLSSSNFYSNYWKKYL